MSFLRNTFYASGFVLFPLAFLTGCATGKNIKGADDIKDDGKSNIVLMTYEANVYVRNRHASADSTDLILSCPQNKTGFGGTCFNLKLPHLGTKDVDGFGLEAFEKSGAKAVKMKYGNYVVQSMQYNIVTERIPKTICRYDKKLKKDICSTRMQDKRDTHSSTLAQPISIDVSQGSGCYLGHLQLSMVDEEIKEYSLDRDSELTEQRLSELPADVAASLLNFVDRPC